MGQRGPGHPVSLACASAWIAWAMAEEPFWTAGDDGIRGTSSRALSLRPWVTEDDGIWGTSSRARSPRPGTRGALGSGPVLGASGTPRSERPTRKRTCRPAGRRGGQKGALRLVTEMGQPTNRGALLTASGLVAPAGQDLEVPGSPPSARPLRCLTSVSGRSSVRVTESSLHSKRTGLRSPSPGEWCSAFSWEHRCPSPAATWPFLLRFPFVLARLQPRGIAFRCWRTVRCA